ncbi:hypothetical protein N4S13_04820 [Enterococcus raffinosus]|uniref:hypothetical protein n=1 Tax=Enterococcus raffinosus TaxID=71452 RepID=UPI0021B49B4C|nr:hypothetical protein [Enterococcus raffinosus]UXC26507.1 hypothetical protein N4S13_04820 [Enterococcus raffinosus]
MNKQEKEQLISFINKAKEDLSFDFGEYHRTHRGYVLGTKVIGYIKHLYEQQKVKARLAKHWDEDLGDCLWWDFPVEEPPYCGTPLDDDFPKYKTHFTELHIPDEVEEEPKWIVCYSTMYLKSPLETGQIETVEITPKKELACHFKSYKEAKQQTSLIGGAVEKVEE